MPLHFRHIGTGGMRGKLGGFVHGKWLFRIFGKSAGAGTIKNLKASLTVAIEREALISLGDMLAHPFPSPQPSFQDDGELK